MIGDFVRRLSALLFTCFALIGTCVLGLAGTAAASGGTTYTPEAPVVDTIEGGPWNTSQGDPSAAGAYPSSDLMPTFAFGGPETTLGGVSEPNVSVYPSASEKEPIIPYPSGVAGTPGPLSGYCNKEESENETGSPTSQPAGTPLPFSPYYFPDIVRNADGSLTGYFDYRPKDADEAITVARSTDNGKTWSSEGKALEQNHGYCPTADTNDDGQGHPFVMSTGSSTDLYTLQRQAGDNPGIGLLVNQVNPSATNPLSAVPTTQPVGIDPNTFVTAATTVPSTGGVPIEVSTLGAAGSPEQIVNGSYEDVPKGSSEPSSSTIINCAGPTSAPSTEGAGSLTGCTSATGAPVELNPGDDLIQVIATGSPTSSSGKRPCSEIGNHVPSGPNNPGGTGGLEALCYSQPSTPVAPITDFLWSSLAPNRVYMNGETVYCDAVSSGRVKLENCTSTGAPFNYTAASEITADPIIPPGATMTNGLVAPDGIIGSLGTGLTSYNGHGVTPGANVVLYTEKILNYYILGATNGNTSASKENYAKGEVALPLTQPTESTPGQFLNYQPSPTTSEPLPCHEGGTSCTSCPSTSSGCSLTVYVGTQFVLSSEHKTKENGPIQALACAGWLPASADTGGSPTPPAGSVDLEACKGSTTPPTGYEQKILEESDVGGPNAAIVPYSVLKQTGEGKNGNTSGPTELFGNNEDLSLLRAAYTTNGVSFTDLGAISSESVTNSGENSGAYTDLSNPNQQESPENSANPTVGTTAPSAPTNLSPGSPDTVELRYIGSRGTIVTNPDGSLGMFLSGSWASDGDSDAFNQIFYTSSTDGGQTWSVPKVVLSTEYEFNASREQDEAPTSRLGISAYYSGRAYGPAVVQNPNGTLTMVFSGYRIPKPITSVGTELGTGSSKYKIGAKDPAIYRNILTLQLKSATSPGVASETTVSASDGGTGVVGAPVTYTATVAPHAPGTGTPTGTVSFADGGTPIAGCASQPLNEGSPDIATCTSQHPSSAGSDEITATYSADANYATSTSPAYIETTTKVSTSTAVSSSDGGSGVVGAPVTYTATVTTGTGTPTGTVSFADSDGQITECASQPLSGSSPDTATCVTQHSSSAGSDEITAIYSGDSSYAESTSSPFAEATTAKPPTVTGLSPDDGPEAGETPVTITGTNLEGATAVDFGMSPATSFEVTSPTTIKAVSPAGTGTVEVTVSTPGGTSLTSFNDEFTYLPPSPVALTSSTNPSAHGAEVTFTAKVSPATEGGATPTGTVTFREGTTVLGSVELSEGSATFSSSSLEVGEHTIIAAYGGDSHNAPGESTGLAQVVEQAATQVALTSSKNPAPNGSSGNLQATVKVVAPGSGSPTGTVTFTEGSTTLATVALTGNTAKYPLKTLTPGTHIITATYSGDSNNESSKSSSITQTIILASTQVMLTSSKNPAPDGSGGNLRATVKVVAPGSGSPTGTVTFTEGSTTLATVALSGNVATYPLKKLTPGTHTIIATYSGDANNKSSESSSITQTIAKAMTQVTLTSSMNPAPHGSSGYLRATVKVVAPGSGMPTGSVTFTEGTTVLATVALSGKTAKYSFKKLTSGTHTIVATYNGDSNSEPGESTSVTQTIEP
jgi:Bacterial Ig-like domain (group 3)